MAAVSQLCRLSLLTQPGRVVTSDAAWYRDRWHIHRRRKNTAPDGLEAREPEVRIDELPEVLVHDIWRSCSFNHRALATCAGETVVVRDTGRINTDGGPDFVDARVRVGDIEWVGDVEIHISSEEWFRHGHQRDPRYNSVVLHVTLFADLWTGAITREDGSTAPEVVLSRHLNAPLRTLLHRFRTRVSHPLVCSNEWPGVPSQIRVRAVRRMSRLRLLRRANEIAATVESEVSLQEVFYRNVFACLGYAKNDGAMRDLASRIPLAVARSLTNPRDVEAVYLGTSGLLDSAASAREVDSATRDYVTDLVRRHKALENTVGAVRMRAAQWQYFRLRPSNFPPLRIAQGCSLIQSGLLSDFAFTKELLQRARSTDAPTFIAELREQLKPPIDSFWGSHYRLERPSKPHAAQLGDTRVRRVIVNTVLPLMIALESGGSRSSALRTCTGLMRSLPAEDDELIRAFTSVGASLPTAEETQGAHELHTTRCANHGCLRCDVGRHILRSPTNG